MKPMTDEQRQDANSFFASELEKSEPPVRSSELVSALIEIRKMAMEHPCFDADCFERRDIDGLCDQGGDICDWTMVAIHADDALRANSEVSDAAPPVASDCNNG